MVMSAKNFGPLVDKVVDGHAEDLWKLSRFLFENPELALEEVKAHDMLCGFLENRGFEVQRNYFLATAFRAEFSASAGTDGPCVALLCEFDALPDIGHACGHNLIAEASIGAALAVKEAMKTDSGVRGKLVVLGTPAEESRGGKEMLASRGALQGIDAALMSHPSPADALAPPFAAAQELVIRFRGRAAHAAASPWDGLNALDAAVASYVNVSLLRQQCKPSWRINGIIAQGGTYANVIPPETVLRYVVRAETSSELLELRGRVEACFRAAASATGCTVDIEGQVPYLHVIHNAAIAGAYRGHGHALGVSFAEDFVKKLPSSGASTDCGNVSHCVPTLHAVFGICQGKAERAANHTREFAALANAAESQPPTLRTAKILALTALDLLTDSQLMGEAREEFKALRPPPGVELQAILSLRV